MCCFSGAVKQVSATRIFARREGTRQALVYSMTVSADQPVAMVLPLPVALPSREDAIEFVDLEGYPDFFDDMEAAFAVTELGLDAFRPGGIDFSNGALEVHDVGAFEASYVPTRNDFLRLDRRFRLPEALWDSLPAYRDYGFAVFKLKAGRNQDVHPMALWFPTRLPDGEVFFPTVHVHDGKDVPRWASFDHTLYVQSSADVADFYPSRQRADTHMDVARTCGLVDSRDPCFRLALGGNQRNADVIAQESPVG
jgi:hypothetical protein